MGPPEFYRVEDEGSRGRYFKGKGMYAEVTDTEFDFSNCDIRLILRHLDWKNRIPTPFLSVYCDEEMAIREAERRVREGKKEVRVYKIDMWESDDRVEYRDLRRLAKKQGIYIPDFAWSNSEYEYLCLHHIPDSAVMGWLSL